jgi:hypothetical protein
MKTIFKNVIRESIKPHKVLIGNSEKKGDQLGHEFFKEIFL